MWRWAGIEINDQDSGFYMYIQYIQSLHLMTLADAFRRPRVPIHELACFSRAQRYTG